MPIDISDKDPEPWDPSQIGKRHKAVATVDSELEQVATSQPPTGWQALRQLIESFPGGTRMRVRSDTKTSVTRKERLKAERKEIEARTKLDTARREYLDGRIQNERYSGDQLDEQVALNREMDKLDRIESLEQRQHDLEMARRRRANELEEPEPVPKRAKNRSKKRTFADVAEDILKYGYVGENMQIAKDKIDKMIVEAGGEENLTEEQSERIEQLLSMALEEDESKRKQKRK